MDEKLTLKDLSTIREYLITGVMSPELEKEITMSKNENEFAVCITTDPASLFGDQEPPSNECVIRYHALLKAAILREYPNADISMSVGPTMRPVICDPEFADEIMRIREKVYLAWLVE
jgi:hypothetical protein